MSERINKRLRRIVTERAKGCCEYCRSQELFATEAFSVEHITPLQAGGLTALDNLALACQGCNGHKYAKTTGYDLVTQQEAPLYHPRQHRWLDHFVWNEDFTMLVGITPIGRATIEQLHLNRPGVMNLRRLLRSVEKHPPAPVEL